MSDKKTDELIVLEPQEDIIPVEKAAGKRFAGFIAGLALFLVLTVIAVVGAGVYFLLPQWQVLQQQPQVLQQTEQNVRQHSASQQQSLQQITQLSQTAEQQQQAVQQLKQQQQQLADQTTAQLQVLKQSVQQKDSAPPRHWLLSEVQYQLQLAAQKVWLEQDLLTAQQLLASAADKLATVDDASLILVRQALAADRQQLSQLPVVDLTSVYLQLHQLRQAVQQLPLKNQEQALAIQAPQADTELKNWRSTLNHYWQQTWSKTIQVRSAVPEDYFSLSAEEQLMVKLSLEQQLLLAELAALKHQPEQFSGALREAGDKLQRYFADADVRVQQFEQQLQQLSVSPVSVTAEPLQSLPLLQQYLQQLDVNGATL